MVVGLTEANKKKKSKKIVQKAPTLSKNNRERHGGPHPLPVPLPFVGCLPTGQGKVKSPARDSKDQGPPRPSSAGSGAMSKSDSVTCSQLGDWLWGPLGLAQNCFKVGEKKLKYKGFGGP